MTETTSRPVVKKGDVFQVGYKIMGCDAIQWDTHQVVRSLLSDGTPMYRPRDAKVDKYPDYWRLPVESTERIIKDLWRSANPKEGKKAIKRISEAPA